MVNTYTVPLVFLPACVFLKIITMIRHQTVY